MDIIKGENSKDNISVFSRDETCTLLNIENNTGDGTMILHSILPGIKVLFSNYHMKNCNSNHKSDSEIFFMEYCKDGRLEWERDSLHYFLGTGNFYVGMHEKIGKNFSMPLGSYHGLSISIDTSELDENVLELFRCFNLNLKELIERYCKNTKSILFKSDKVLERIVCDIYNFPSIGRDDYLKVKVIELLLYLNRFEITKSGINYEYFYKSQVEKIKEIQRFIVSNCNKHYTLQELSSIFDIPLSAMKKCFKGVFGSSIYSYLQKYRMNIAAKMLKETNDKIEKIAWSVGYENPSKFSAVFKKTTGKSPRNYRNSLHDLHILKNISEGSK